MSPPLGLLALAAAALLLSPCTGNRSRPPGGDDRPVVSAGAPAVLSVGDQTVAEQGSLSLAVTVRGFDKKRVRVMASGLPPGARWSETARRLFFRPDFIQGGRSWRVTVRATDGRRRAGTSFNITVADTIQPPWPVIVSSSVGKNHTRLLLRQTTDAYLDSPGFAGRSFEARVVIPTGASASRRRPVRVHLHGLGGKPYKGSGGGGQFRIYPHDDHNTYWWGYSDQLPDGAPTRGTVPNYTQRRALHLLEWVLARYPGADAERVYLTGSSMGGAGAKTLGLLHARHFCLVEASVGQAIPRNHRPARLAQLKKLWGAPVRNLPARTLPAPGTGVWDQMDLTRALRDSAEARDQFVFTKHGKDDRTIHFGAMIRHSPLTGVSFYQALQHHHVGHHAVWDEGGHGNSQLDPVLGSRWWDSGWSRVFHKRSFLRRDLPFPAFSKSDADEDPGSGRGNGSRPWHRARGFAGKVRVPGDTGWGGTLAGALNRFLRWDARGFVDRWDRLEMPLRVLSGAGVGAVVAGYPSRGDLYAGPLPLVVDVTPRRVRGFVCRPGEQISWSFGGARGTVTADRTGAVTVPMLKLTTNWTTLVLTRK